MALDEQEITRQPVEWCPCEQQQEDDDGRCLPAVCHHCPLPRCDVLGAHPTVNSSGERSETASAATSFVRGMCCSLHLGPARVDSGEGRPSSPSTKCSRSTLSAASEGQ